MSGYSLWVWWYSLINSGLFGGAFGGTTGGPVPTIDEVSGECDPDAGTLEVMGDVAAPSAVSAILVRVSRPLPPGRTPTGRDLRSIGFIPVGTVVDVASMYLAFFGVLPGVGTRLLIDLRYASADDRVASEPVRFIITCGPASGSFIFEVECLNSPIVWIGPADITFAIDSDDHDENYEFKVVLLTANWSVFGEIVVVNHQPTWVYAYNDLATPGDETLQWEAWDSYYTELLGTASCLVTTV